jgi:hypothetical protein
MLNIETCGLQCCRWTVADATANSKAWTCCVLDSNPCVHGHDCVKGNRLMVWSIQIGEFKHKLAILLSPEAGHKRHLLPL